VKRKRISRKKKKQSPDRWFADLIDEGMKEKGTVPLERIKKKLRRAR